MASEARGHLKRFVRSVEEARDYAEKAAQKIMDQHHGADGYDPQFLVIVCDAGRIGDPSLSTGKSLIIACTEGFAEPVFELVDGEMVRTGLKLNLNLSRKNPDFGKPQYCGE